jgi:hypothetical protein
MTGEQRLLLAFEMSLFARHLSRERIRREQSDWTETQIARELLRLAFFPRPCPTCNESPASVSEEHGPRIAGG